ncbi:MAG: hypothetical protein WDO15_13720 [Bacteroidota bacterium]
MKWTIENITPIAYEPMSSRSDYMRRIVAAPNDFEWDGYQGNMSNWQDFGQWFAKLNVGRDKLPDEAKAKVRALVKDKKTNEEEGKSDLRIHGSRRQDM